MIIFMSAGCAARSTYRPGPEFLKALLESLHACESTYVDLSEVTFFGVAGAEALIQARDAADLHHAVLRIDGSARVQRVLEMLRLSGDFEFCA
ncbi:STAS domain-containing protein [Nocardia sp. NPDC059764]|uniref:STAS domain-containing protein n=1 Tax=Nocardia sp. NPDC059764 TaxID=3346939 RepID=UPI003651EF09